MKKYLKWGLISAIIAAAGVAIAQVPNTFSAGQPVTASAMNQNFNYAAVPHVKDGTGVTIGKVIGMTDANIYVLNNNGYKMKVDYLGNIFNDQMAMIITATGTNYFSNNTCTSAIPAGSYLSNVSPATIYNLNSVLYYTSITATVYPIIYFNAMSGGCSPWNYNVINIIPNAAATTGVSAVSYTGPLTIQ